MEIKQESLKALAELGLTNIIYHTEMKEIQAAFFTEEDAREWLDSFVSLKGGRIKYAWLVEENDGRTSMWYVTPSQ